MWPCASREAHGIAGKLPLPLGIGRVFVVSRDLQIFVPAGCGGFMESAMQSVGFMDEVGSIQHGLAIDAQLGAQSVYSVPLAVVLTIVDCVSRSVEDKLHGWITFAAGARALKEGVGSDRHGIAFIATPNVVQHRPTITTGKLPQRPAGLGVAASSQRHHQLDPPSRGLDEPYDLGGPEGRTG